MSEGLPSARLINSFGNEFGWESVVELLPVLERIVDLSVGHRSRFEPAVKHFGDPAERRFAWALRWYHDRVDRFAVEIRHFDARQFLQFLDGSDTDELLAVVRHPNGNGGAPVAVAAHRPVSSVAEPVTEAFLFDEIGNPVSVKSCPFVNNFSSLVNS